MNTSGPVRDAELDIRSLRYFVAVAEELNFTRAAARVFVAQQAISREIRQLERQLGVALFVRTTRRVTLTPEGSRLLARARELVALHDQTVEEIVGPTRPVILDLLSEGRLTGHRLLDGVRRADMELEFRSRYDGAMAAAMRRLQAAEIDAAVGRADWVGQQSTPGLERRLLRLEPLAVLLPASHPLAALDAVPVQALRGLEIDVNPQIPDALEWLDLARQFLTLAEAVATPPHVPALALEDQADHLVRQGVPIVTAVDHVAVPGGVVRPLVEPVPLYPWSLVWRRALSRRVVNALENAAATLVADGGWLTMPDDPWLCQPEASTLSRGRPPDRARRVGMPPRQRPRAGSRCRGSSRRRGPPPAS